MSYMTDLRLYLFGTPRLEFQGNPVNIERRKAFALAAFLALSGQPQSRDLLGDFLWPELDHEHGRSALRSTLRALTVAVPVEWVAADRASLALKPDQVWVDVNAFTGLIAQSSNHNHPLDAVCEDCVTNYKQALALYRADFLAGYHLVGSPDYEDWQFSQREWLRREVSDLQRRLSDYYAQNLHYDQAIKHAHQWLGLDSLHEPAHRQLMRLYAANGQRSEAMRQYQQCVEVLDAELATPPESETVQLYESIQKDYVPTWRILDAVPAAFFSILPPLPPLIIGREQSLHEIKQRLGINNGETRPITVIQGWPGVGKSTIAALLAHDPDIARHFPHGILWASLGETPDISATITTWADALKLTEPGQVRKVEDVSAQITAVLRDKRVLLILDDVWRVEHAAPFRVGGQLCAMLMTSRLNDVAAALAPTANDIYRLSVLSETAGLDLLGRLTPETVAQHPDECQELVRDLEGLPLALHVAGRLLHIESTMGWGVKDLLAELRTGSVLLNAQAPSDMLAAARQTTSPTVLALLKRSTDSLDEETRRHFAYLGLFVPKPATFHLEAMAVAWNVDDPKPIARKLVNRGLIEPVSGGRFQMHALLVLHAHSLLADE